MDRRRTLAALLIGILGMGAVASTPMPIREANWIAPHHRLALLSSVPPTCVRPAASTPQVTIGAAAFRAPLLLGGQAARAQISCASCHRNGRGNHGFLFPGLSTAPGTADVTSSLMSKMRGDGMFNPVRIPDLTFDTPKISRARDSDDLRKFIRGLIVEEFDGAEPPARILDGLVAYVRALEPQGCSPKETPLTLATHITDIQMALDAAATARLDGDTEAASLLIGSARSTLGLVFERYQADALAKERQQIVRYDMALALLQRGAQPASDVDPAKRLADLVSTEPQSLYNAGLLARALQR